jgi:hypothetical protein
MPASRCDMRYVSSLCWTLSCSWRMLSHSFCYACFKYLCPILVLFFSASFWIRGNHISIMLKYEVKASQKCVTSVQILLLDWRNYILLGLLEESKSVSGLKGDQDERKLWGILAEMSHQTPNKLPFRSWRVYQCTCILLPHTKASKAENTSKCLVSGGEVAVGASIDSAW